MVTYDVFALAPLVYQLQGHGHELAEKAGVLWLFCIHFELNIARIKSAIHVQTTRNYPM